MKKADESPVAKQSLIEVEYLQIRFQTFIHTYEFFQVTSLSG